MDTPSIDKLPEKDRKIFKKTMGIESSVVLLKEILKFYSCPAECEGKCCKVYDIPLSVADRKKISKISKTHKKIIESEVIEKSEPLHGIEVRKNVFKTMPCPFLKSDKCGIYQHRPSTCSIYPFHAYENNIEELVIDACFLGSDLIVDLIGFELLCLSRDDPRAKAAFEINLKEAQKIIVSVLKADKKALGNLPTMNIQNTDILRFFLFQLRTMPPDVIRNMREKTIGYVISSIGWKKTETFQEVHEQGA